MEPSLTSFIESVARAFHIGEAGGVSAQEAAQGLKAAVDLASAGIDPFSDPDDEVITIPVDSTCLAIVQYTPSDEELRLLFAQSGLWYSYSDVSPEVVEKLVDAPSIGAEFNASIRDDYTFKREG